MLSPYTNFFAAIAQAAAALVGLLFVALSIDVGLEPEFRARQLAISEVAFVSLGGIFLIALLALLPSGIALAGVGGAALSIVGIADLFHIRKESGSQGQQPGYWYVIATIVAYLCLAFCGIWIAVEGPTGWALDLFCLMLIVLSALSLSRAWRALLINKGQPV